MKHAGTMNRLVGSRSSFLVYWPVILFLFGAMIAGFLMRLGILAFLLLVFFLLALVCRLWIWQSGRKIELKMTGEFDGLYPGQEGRILFQVTNNKLLPVFRADFFYPLSVSQCLTPEETRPSMEWEKTALQEMGACTETVGETRLSYLSWYESRTIQVTWTARRRGIYSTRGWSFRTGDGFGLGQSEQKPDRKYQRDLAVFPERIPVDSAFFMKNAWNSDTGTRGILEDHTVIRSVRDYMPGDNVKQINWRLTARGLPLSVNVYEEILPQNALFLFDGESFAGPVPHPEEMEEALSIAGSAAAALAEQGISCGLCLSKGAYSAKYANTPVGAGLSEVLWAMAAYVPKKPVTDEENKVIRQAPEFDRAFAAQEQQTAGRCYYFTYDPDLSDAALLAMLGEGKTVVLSFLPGKPVPGILREDIRRLRKNRPQPQEPEGGVC